MRAFATGALEAAGFEVTASASGLGALKLLPRGRFDLVVTDINMPDINGLELIQLVRRLPHHAGVPMLIISTDGAARDRERGLSLGAVAYLVKPFAPDELVRAAQQALSGATAAG